MSEQFLLALCFTQIGQIPTGNGGNCGWLRRKLSECHHNSFFPLYHHPDFYFRVLGILAKVSISHEFDLQGVELSCATGAHGTY